MSASNKDSTEQSGQDFTRTWRYKVGLTLIIVGHLALLVGILLPILGLAPKGHAGLVGILIVGGEVVGLSSIAFLGKAGFMAIKAKIFSSVKAGYTSPVGPVRYYIGIALACTQVATLYILMLYAWQSFVSATPEGPHPIVWGLDLAQQGSMVMWLFFVGEISFLLAIYVVGARGWGKFRSFFVWDQPGEQE